MSNLIAKNWVNQMASVSKAAQRLKLNILNNTKHLKVDEQIRMYNWRNWRAIITGISVNMNSAEDK